MIDNKGEILQTESRCLTDKPYKSYKIKLKQIVLAIIRPKLIVVVHKPRTLLIGSFIEFDTLFSFARHII